MNRDGYPRAGAFAAGLALALLTGAASAAEPLEPSNCTIDACRTSAGYAIQIVTRDGVRPAHPMDSAVARQNDSRADVSGRFLVRLPGGGLLWATEDPAVHDPRLAAHAPAAVPVANGRFAKPLEFSVYKNYDAFIERVELLIFDGADIDHVEPLVTLLVPPGNLQRVRWNGKGLRPLEAGETLHYYLRAYDAGGRRDQTRLKTITAVDARDYGGPDNAYAAAGLKESPHAAHRVAPDLAPAAAKTTAASAGIPLDGNVLVLQPPVEELRTESVAYTLTPHFDTRKTELKPDDKAELDRIIAGWTEARNVRIHAIGHTDSIRIAPEHRHEFADNQLLSERRAEAVARYLAKALGLTNGNVKTGGRGPKEPVASNATARGRAQNRRVELQVQGDRVVRRIIEPHSVDVANPRTGQAFPVTDSLEEALNISGPGALPGFVTAGMRSVTATGYATAAPAETGAGRGAVCGIVDDQLHAVQAVYGRNDLETQNIPVYGSRVRLHGEAVSGGNALQVNGHPVPVADRSKFAVEYMLPVGQHKLDVEFVDQACNVAYRTEVPANVSGRHMFIVGLADLTLSQGDVSGSIEPLSVDDRYADDFLVEGRLAFYLKGKIRGKYLVTAQLDTTEDDIGDLLSDIDEKDPRRVLRRLDPDRYYPVYGDDSTTISDADTQGRFYLRADWDNSHALWGNFHTGYTDGEFTQYNRSLYGAQLDWRSLNANSSGGPRSRANLFVSEAQTAFGHTEFVGTGGSLYYLKHTDLRPGSEKAWVEIRDRDSNRVLSNMALERGVDYQVDELQGRMILTRPLLQITRLLAPALIKDAPLDGNDVILLVDYEYLTGPFDTNNMTVGAHGKQWLGDHLAVAGTYVRESRDAGDDYGLLGGEVTLQAAPNTFVKAEFAQSEASQVQRFFSDDGGLEFEDVTPNRTGREGDAYGVEARINSRELWDTEGEWAGAAWWRRTDDNFSIARRDPGVDTVELGAELVATVTDRLKLTGRASTVEREGVDEDKRFSVQADYLMTDRSTASGELRQIRDENATGADIDGTLGALRLSYKLSSRVEVYGTAQFTLANDDGRYDNNDMLTVGGVVRVGERTNLAAEYSSGHRGDGAILTLDHELNDRHRIYGTYTQSPDRTDTLAENQMAIGQRSLLSNQITVYNEHQFSEYRDQASVSNVFGLDFAPKPGWTLGVSYQTGDLETDAAKLDRDVVSGTLAYRGARVHWSSKLEWRTDDGTRDSREQWVTSTRADYQYSENTRLLARFNHAETDDDLDANANARFTEAQVGLAYRPVHNDRFNMLAKYTYLYDLRGLQQEVTGTDQRSNILSVEGIYRLSQRWDVGGKYALRRGELRTNRDRGDWFESQTSFAALRGRYHLIRAWDGVLEYRWLDVDEANSTRSGWLAGLDRHFGEHLKLGIGYNFTDFSDDLTNLDYDSKGWFINAVGKY